LDPVRGHEQAGRRHVLILSHDVFNERSGTVIAAALTRAVDHAGQFLFGGPRDPSADD
jgi:mRNA interferase MazF